MRMKADKAKHSGTSLVLCYLTDDYQSRVSDGPKNKGQVIRYKFGVTASDYEWQLTEFREGSTPSIRVHAANFTHLCPFFKTEAGLSAFDSMLRCQQSLESIAKINPNFKPLNGFFDIDLAIDYAEQVDLVYQTNFTLHDNVRKRFFGEAEDETEE